MHDKIKNKTKRVAAKNVILFFKKSKFLPTIRKLLKRLLISAIILFFWLFVWNFLADQAGSSTILPAPAETFARLWELAQEGEFYLTLTLSFLRVCHGFSIGMVLGFALGMLSHYIPFFKKLISPFMAVVRATPVASFILAVFFWMTSQQIPTFISLLMVLPVVWQNTILGFEKKDPQLDEMAEVFRLSPLRKFMKIDLPQVLSFTMSAGKTALGLAWKAGVAAEVLCYTEQSVGKMIYHSKMYLATIDLFAWTCAIILFSVGLEKLFSLIFSGRRRKNADRI